MELHLTWKREKTNQRLEPQILANVVSAVLNRGGHTLYVTLYFAQDPRRV